MFSQDMCTHFKITISTQTMIKSVITTVDNNKGCQYVKITPYQGLAGFLMALVDDCRVIMIKRLLIDCDGLHCGPLSNTI